MDVYVVWYRPDTEDDDESRGQLTGVCDSYAAADIVIAEDVASEETKPGDYVVEREVMNQRIS